MEKTIGEIAQAIGAELEGNPKMKIRAVRAMEQAGEGDLTFLSDKKNLKELEKSKASAVIVFSDCPRLSKTLLRVANPSLGLAKVLQFLKLNSVPHSSGIHPTALLGKEVQLGKDVAIGPYAVIGEGCRIGNRTIIHGGVQIGPNCEIGDDTVLFANVTLRERTQIGNRVILHPGAVIGADGFGFVPTEEGHQKIPQVGRVVIEDDVEIGANACVDRATLETTVIGRGTKIDNLVQVGHNVILGEHCILVGQVGIGGSARLGNFVIIGGQTGIRDHVTVADGVRVGGQSAVAGDILERGDYLGVPAVPGDQFLEVQAYLKRLPELFKELEEVKRKLENIL